MGVAVWGRVVQCWLVFHSVLQCVTVCCRHLHVCCSVGQREAAVGPFGAVQVGVLQCRLVCCSALQDAHILACVEVLGSMLQL